ncbi:hypothetical protein [Flavobacterium sp. HSC-61S13]|uniref:hypothetical protein n=1 Tax=Flavobacterium sp. HSC-61S13 TaxID=2910963 RepID=UPI00209CD311|nr:hypothetical protein [Flavobacterium sp. HSC-61S13]MCP1996479.1 hypothetical protein [Flavobacterium sp. HSC-61S13]
MTKKELVEKEIFDFHQNIKNWFRGNLSDKTIALKNLIDPFDSDFKLRNGDDKTMDFQQFIEWLPTAYGRSPDQDILVSDIMIYLSDNHALATYIETQSSNGQTTVRKSSAIFLLGKNKRISWYHLMETWI